MRFWVGRLVVGLVAVLLAGCTATGASEGSRTATTPVSAAPTSAGGGSYLALGDSVPFGFRGGLAGEYRDATNFVGYPEMVGADLGLDVINATCPGETTASLLNTVG